MNKPGFSSRMVATVKIQFDCGSEYGAAWTFAEAYEDAKRAAETMCRTIHQTNPRIKVLGIEAIHSHVMEQKT
jgi:hypothetical protein